MPTTTVARFRAARAPRAPRSASSPLDHAYERVGLSPAAVRVVGAGEIPEPYRTLLAHDDDMTRTIEEHVRDRIVIRPLMVEHRARRYTRRVLLVQASSGRPAGMGAVRLDLDALGPRVRSQIVRAEAPLGRVLRDARLAYRRRIVHFLAVVPNAEMMGVFWMREPLTLYGRQTILTLKGARFGQVVDVLPLV